MFVWSEATKLADGAFFAGFVAGDGGFFVKPNNAGASWSCGLQVKLRADDTPLLTALKDWSVPGIYGQRRRAAVLILRRVG